MTEAELIAEGEIDPGPEGQWCTECGELKPLWDYYESWKSSKHVNVGIMHTETKCKVCRGAELKLAKAKHRYGLDKDQYRALKQRTHCELCDDELAKLTKGGFIDHCHKTGVVRGVLCLTCNFALGVSRDDADRLEQWAAKAVEYMRRCAVL